MTSIFFFLRDGFGSKYHHAHFNTRTWNAEWDLQLYLTQIQWLMGKDVICVHGDLWPDAVQIQISSTGLLSLGTDL